MSSSPITALTILRCIEAGVRPPSPKRITVEVGHSNQCPAQTIHHSTMSYSSGDGHPSQHPGEHYYDYNSPSVVIGKGHGGYHSYSQIDSYGLEVVHLSADNIDMDLLSIQELPTFPSAPRNFTSFASDDDPVYNPEHSSRASVFDRCVGKEVHSVDGMYPDNLLSVPLEEHAPSHSQSSEQIPIHSPRPIRFLDLAPLLRDASTPQYTQKYTHLRQRVTPPPPLDLSLINGDIERFLDPSEGRIVIVNGSDSAVSLTFKDEFKACDDMSDEDEDDDYDYFTFSSDSASECDSQTDSELSEVDFGYDDDDEVELGSKLGIQFRPWSPPLHAASLEFEEEKWEVKSESDVTWIDYPEEEEGPEGCDEEGELLAINLTLAGFL